MVEGELIVWMEIVPKLWWRFLVLVLSLDTKH